MKNETSLVFVRGYNLVFQKGDSVFYCHDGKKENDDFEKKP